MPLMPSLVCADRQVHSTSAPRTRVETDMRPPGLPTLTPQGPGVCGRRGALADTRLIVARMISEQYGGRRGIRPGHQGDIVYRSVESFDPIANEWLRLRFHFGRMIAPSPQSGTESGAGETGGQDPA